MYKYLNMFKFGKYFAMLCLMMLIIIQGCEEVPEHIEPEEPDPIEIQNQTVNEWILDHMEVYYYWNTQIPKNINTKLNPDVYFYSLLHKDDKFSVIYDDAQALRESLSGVNSEAGYEYNLLYLDENEFDLIGYITYTKPGTPAKAAGLKRGEFFLEINNTQLNINNYMTLLRETSKQHTLGMANFSGNMITGIRNVELPVVVYEENPILLDTLYHIQDKKIGYFVYNFFARDSEENGIKYEKEMNELFGMYKTEGIDELIIDMRYNMGGTVSTAQALSSMITNLSSNDVFGYSEYNSLLHSYFSSQMGINYNVTYFLDEIVSQNNRGTERVTINKLGLSRIYLIVSRQTASASELVINGLRPYLGDNNVVLIGETTYGKNVGSVLFEEEDPVKQESNKWGILPIVIKLANKNRFSDYGNGFKPDVEVHETSDLLNMKPLGDIEELMLATTLDEIFGVSKSKSKNDVAKVEIVASSIDRTPARKNMYIYDRKNSLSGRD